MIADVFPVNVTVPVPGVKVVPVAADQLTATLIVVAVPAANVPDVNVIVPFSVRVVVLPPTLKVCAVFATVILLNVCVTAVPLIACATAALLKLTTPAPGVNVAPLFAQSPATLIVTAVPAVKAPAVNVIPAFNVNVVVLPLTLRVCPGLFTIRLLNV